VTEVTLNARAASTWSLDGELDFASVPAVWPAVAEVISENRRVTLSLDAVRHANSAGLVLLVEARDLARQTGCDLRLVDLPAELVDLARMSQCEALITDG
jgi:phospholipid transport system transporter-binding protein